MLKILGRNNSSNVQKVLWCCDELGLKYEREDVGGPFGRNRDPEYLALNPNGLVPTIIDGDFVLWESNTIIRYLAAKHGEGTLYPRDLQTRAMAERWMDWQLSVVGPAMMPIVVGLIRTPPEKRDQAAIAAARDKLATAMKMLDSFLGRSDYVAGASFTVGDIPVGIMTYRWYTFEIKREDFPNLKRWYERLSTRPGFKKHVMIGLT
jgi:glutathione S-transferase